MLKPFLYLSLCMMLWAENAPKVFWPSPPDPARIAFVSSFSDASDLKIEKGFFTKLWDFIAGNEERVLVKPFGLHASGKTIYVCDVASRALFIFDREKKEMSVIEA